MEPSSSDTGAIPEIPPEAPKKKSWTKIAAVVIAIVLIIVAVAAWQLLQGGKEATLTVRSVTLGGTQGTVRGVNTQLSFGARVDGPVSEYKWEFGDSKGANETTNATTHTYDTKGVYLVLLTAKSPGGQTATNDGIGLLQVTIVNAAQSLGNTSAVAVAFANVTFGPPSTQVGFDGNSSYGFDFNWGNFNRSRQPFYDPNADKVSNWAWKFGDGSADVTGGRAAAAKPPHTYSSAGLYGAKLTVTSSALGGLTDSAYISIRIRPPAVTGSVIKNPDALIIGAIGDPQYLDPAIDYETSGGEVIKNVYDRLITREVTYQNPASPVINNSKIVGLLAESWTRSLDGLTWNFTIRQGVHFHDGSTLTAYDVEYSLRRVLVINRGPAWILDQSMTYYASDDPATPINERWEAINASIVATSPRYVEFHLALPYGAFLYTLDFEVASILSKAWVEAHGGTVWGARNTYVSRNTMGTGPYKLDHWTPGVDLELVKNTDYWGTPKPKLNTILYKQILDPATQELLLKNGDIDWADGIPQSDINLVKTFANVEVKENPSIVIQYLGMNINNSWAGSPSRSPNTSPFRDVHVRRAVSYAMDYAYMQQTILQGYGYQMKSPIPIGMPFYNPSYWHYGDGTVQSRIPTAQAEMAQADPSLRNGFTTELWYNTGNPTRDQIAVMVQANLAQIGITVNIRGVSWPEFLTAMDYREAPLFIIGWAPDYLDPDDYIYPLFHSSACPTWVTGSGDPGDSTEGTAAACYEDPQLDAWIDDAATNQSQTARGLLYDLIQQKIADDAPWVFLYQPKALDPIRSWLKGYYFDPMELKDFLPLYKEL